MSILASSGLTLYLAGVLTPILIGHVALYFMDFMDRRMDRTGPSA